jgi:asparagine synthase (glutamine-hydrolysing)
MCGLVGLIKWSSGVEGRDHNEVKTILSFLQHRGPDHTAIKQVGAHCLLGANRLAITDPANTNANMPFLSADGKTAIVFNGEIYNHLQLRNELSDFKFRTDCDTETVLAAYERWGSKLLSRIEGMFAFIIFDEAKNSLFAAVDPAGQKPLYYLHDEDVFLFASEMEPLIRDDRRSKSWNYRGIAEIIARRFTIGEETHIQEIKRLRPGHFICLGRDSYRIDRWFTMPIGDQNDDDIETVSTRLANSFRLACANTCTGKGPIGVLLSGGLDSSAVAFEAARSGRELHTFSIGFEPFEGPTFEPGWIANEFPFSRKVANALQSCHHEIQISREEYFDLFRSWGDTIADPLCVNDGAAMWKLFAEAKKHCRVVLGGSGADEIFDGYNHDGVLTYGAYIESALGSNIRNCPDLYFDVDLRLFGCSLEELLPSCDVRKWIIEKMSSDLDPYYPSVSSPLQLTQLLMFHGRLASYEFAQVDRTSMLCSVEARSPFAEPCLLREAFNFSPRLKFHNQSEKWILKQAFRRLGVPEEIVMRKKAAFPLPSGYLFSPEFTELVLPVLSPESALVRTGLVSLNFLTRLWESPHPAARPVFSRLSTLNRILTRHERYVGSLGPEKLDLP